MWVEGLEGEESVWEVNKRGQIERDQGNENRIANTTSMHDNML